MGVEGDFRRPMETVPRQQDTFPRMYGNNAAVSISLILASYIVSGWEYLERCECRFRH